MDLSTVHPSFWDTVRELGCLDYPWRSARTARSTRPWATTTHDTYQRTLNNIVFGRIGDLRLREIDVPLLEDLFEELEEEGLSANNCRSVRTTISGTLQTAVRYGLLDRNSVREISPIEGGPRKVRALSADERLRLLASVDQYVVENRLFRNSELPDLVRFLLGTGCRIGEALAVRWRDVNLTNKPVISEDGTVIPPRSVWINGNIVNVTGKGLVRHPGKTENANRFIALPQFAVTVLTVRLLIAWSAAKGEELNTAPAVALERLSDGGYVEVDSEQHMVRVLGGGATSRCPASSTILSSHRGHWDGSSRTTCDEAGALCAPQSDSRG